MHSSKLSPAIIISAFLFACSCNNPDSSAKTGNPSRKSANDTSRTTTTPTTPEGTHKSDSMLSQIKNLSSMLGKDDLGILSNLGGGGSMDSMMKKLQPMNGRKNGSPGDAVANSILNLQLGQMKDDNPLKSVARGMMEAQKNGTAGPSKTYTATYTSEQSVDYHVPVSGNGTTIVLQYTGGTVANNKKDGLWKNLYVSTTGAKKWNVYSEAYAESSAINVKVHT